MQRRQLRTLALAAAGLVVISATAVAQGPAARVLEQRQELQLTAEQVKQLEAIRTRQAAAFAREDSIYRARRAEWQKSRDEVMAVLTPEQRGKVTELHRKHRAEWRKERKGHRHGPRDERGGSPPDSAAS